jgi:hypothetical protein
VIDAGDSANRRSAIGKADGNFLAAEVMCVREHVAIGHDHARTALVAADSYDRRTSLAGSALDRALEIVDERHWLVVPLER